MGSDVHVHSRHTEAHIDIHLDVIIVLFTESFILGGGSLLDSHSTESHVHFNMFTVATGGSLGNSHTGHTHIDVHLDIIVLSKALVLGGGGGLSDSHVGHSHIDVHLNVAGLLLVGDVHLSSDHAAHVDVNVHARHALVEGDIDETDFLRSPVSRDGDLDELDFRIVDFNRAGDGGSRSAASVHGARDFQEVFGSDEFTLGGTVEDVVVFLKVDQMVHNVEGLELAVVTSLESREIDSNQVAVTGATGSDTRKGSGDFSQISFERLAFSRELEFLLKGEADVGVVELRVSVIKLHDDLSSFTRSIVSLFELSSKGVGSLSRATGSEVGSDFITNTLHSALDGLSDDEVLLELELGFTLERGFQDSFELIADVSKISGTFLVERAGKSAGEHEGEGDGVLTRHQSDPVVNGGDHFDDFMGFFMEFIDFTGFSNALAVLLNSSMFSSLGDNVDMFSTNELKVKLVSRIGQEEVEIDFTSDGITTEIGGLVSLETDSTVASSFSMLFTHIDRNVVTH